MIKARVDNQNWVRCAECGHKLFKVVGAGYCDPPPIIEVKCHSCKTINQWAYDVWRNENDK